MSSSGGQSGYNPASANCTANYQSPVNLSQSTAKECERACDFSVDPIETQSAKVSVVGSFMIQLTSLSPPPTATYNNVRYVCDRIELYRAAQHAYDNSWNQHELVARFTSPGYKTVMMSVPVNSSGTTGSPSTNFFSAFVGHTDSQSAISLGSSWTLQNAIPQDMSYFAYEGRTFMCDEAVMWIVYKNSIQINTTDEATVVRVLTKAWKKPLQQLSPAGASNERYVFFRSEEQENPAYVQRDGKVYMKCRRLNTKGQIAGEETFSNMREGFFGGAIEGLENPPAIKSGNVKTAEKKKKDAESEKQAKNFWARVYAFYLQFGGLWGILLIVFSGAFVFLLNTLWSHTLDEMFDWFVAIPNLIHEFISPPQ